MKGIHRRCRLRHGSQRRWGRRLGQRGGFSELVRPHLLQVLQALRGPDAADGLLLCRVLIGPHTLVGFTASRRLPGPLSTSRPAAASVAAASVGLPRAVCLSGAAPAVPAVVPALVPPAPVAPPRRLAIALADPSAPRGALAALAAAVATAAAVASIVAAAPTTAATVAAVVAAATAVVPVAVVTPIPTAAAATAAIG